MVSRRHKWWIKQILGLIHKEEEEEEINKNEIIKIK